MRLISTSPDDVPDLNPKGRPEADVTGNEKRIPSFTKVHKLGTWNVRSMCAGKLDLVRREMMRTGVQLLGVSEMRWTGMGRFQSEDYTVFYSGHDSTRENGVAIICEKGVAASVLGYNPVNDRIIVLRLQGKPVHISIIQVYAPTSAAAEERHHEFYSQLQQTVDKVPRGDVLIIMGDMNAKIGEGHATMSTGRHGLGERNEAGVRMMEFCESNSLRVMNTHFPQPKRRQYTWTSPDGVHRNQIDYILIQTRWKSSIQYAKTLPGADCGTDHELLVAGLKVRLRRLKKDTITPKYDLTNISASYTIETKNRFSCLECSGRDPEELWQSVKAAVKSSADVHIPKLRKRKKTTWISDVAIDIADRRRHIKAAGADRREIQKLNGDFQRQARVDKEKYVNDICNDIERCNKQGKTRDLFRRVRELTGKFSPMIGCLKNSTGKSILERSEIKDRWKEYTENLYKKDKRITESFQEREYVREPSVSHAEVRKAINEIKSSKAPGSDGIPIELLKATGEEGIHVMTTLCQQIWDTGIWPLDWKKTVYIPIPKKGDPRVCANNRTIALISHASKVMLKIIQGRMEQNAQQQLPDVQAGFRKSRGTRDQIANVRWLMERAHEYNQQVYLCFIDYSKAFDCVDHDKLWNTLRKMGFPEHLIALLHGLYDNQQATVRVEGGDTEPFGIGKGVRQGCILSPTLFNLYAEEVMREADIDDTDIGIRVGGRVLNNLRYADDTTLAAETEDDLRALIERVTLSSEKAGLYLNIKKTKVMSNSSLSTFSANGEDIEVVKNFNLLGSMLSHDGSCEGELSRRLALGRASMAGLRKIWKDRDLMVATKLRLVEALVFPVATYGCETWTLTKAQKSKVRAFEQWCWRRLLRIPWTAKRTNESVVYEINPGNTLENKMMNQKLSYFGHVMRSHGLEKDVMLGMGNGSRSRGRPRRRWMDEIREVTGLGLTELSTVAADRMRWRRLVKVVTRGRHRPDGTR